jgi:[ribosomal protein S5]-alanine N-acetyltransferase
MTATLKTRRLVLRALSAADLPRVAELAGDWQIACMTARVPYPYSLAQAEQWFRTLDAGEFVRVIEWNGELIGMCGYTLHKGNTAEIGYWIGRPWWGHGFATEAADHLVRHCLKTTRVGKLTCCHFADNLASARVIQKLGFKPVGQCSAYCEARRKDVLTLTYERHRTVIEKLWRHAA